MPKAPARRFAPPTRTVPVARSAPGAAPSLAVAAIALAGYFGSTPRFAGPGDSSELTAVLATLGLAHPTGYPLYTLVGHALVVAAHALGASWAWAANAFSALGAATALGLWHAFAARLLAREGVGGRVVLLAALPVSVLACNAVWLGEARFAEVNSWHVSWVAAACLFAWTTATRFDARVGKGERPTEAWIARRVALWSLLVGLGVSHHATAVLFAAPLTVALLAVARPTRPATLAPALLGLAVPPLAWTYVLYRSAHPAAVQWGSLGPGLASTWNHVTAAGYHHYLGGFAPTPVQAAELSAHVYPLLVVGAVATLAWALATRGAARPVALALGAALALQAAYVFSYAVGDPAPYFLPALALGLCVAPAALVRATARRKAAQAAVVAAGVVLVGVVAWQGVRSACEDDAGLAQVDGLFRTMWSAVPIQRGYVIWDSDLSARLVCYQRLEGLKPRLVVVRPRLLMDEDTRALWARAHGFDPLHGQRPPDDAHADDPATIRAFAAAIGDGINAATRDSVILFEPEKPALELLPKPANAR